MENTIIYLVKICSGQHDSYGEEEVFATTNKDIAEKWRDKYNRIINDNKDRINQYYNDGNYNKPKPFWFDEIWLESPIAKINKVKLR